MPLAREAKLPFNRVLLNRVLKSLNVIVILAGALTILMVLYLQQIPTFSPGWLLIFMGVLVIIGGLSGFGGTTLPCCYITHILTTSCSAFGVLVFSLVLFGEVDSLLMHCSWAYLVLFALQICCIIGRSILQRMTSNMFETNEQTQDSRNIMMSQMRRDIGEQQGRVDRTAANTIEEKMASKYGEFTITPSGLDIIVALTQIFIIIIVYLDKNDIDAILQRFDSFSSLKNAPNSYVAGKSQMDEMIVDPVGMSFKLCTLVHKISSRLYH